LAGSLLVSLFLLQVSTVLSDPDAFNVAPVYGDQILTTKTVYGFGDYITTIGNTVMLFTPTGGAPITATAAPGIDSLLTEQYEDTIQIESRELKSPDIQPTSVTSPQDWSETDVYDSERTEENSLETDSKEEEEAGLTHRLRGTHRKTANQSFKEKLKQRYLKAKTEEDKQDKQETSNRRSFTVKSSKLRLGGNSNVFFGEQEDHTEAPRPRTFRSRVSRQKTASRSFKKEEEKDETADVGRGEFGRSTSSFGRRRRPESRLSFSNRNKNSQEPSRISAPKIGDFKSRGSSTYRQDSRRDSTEIITTEQPSKNSKSFSKSKSKTPTLKLFKKFNRFDRPDIRKTLLSKFLKNRPNSRGNQNTLQDKQEEEEESPDPDHEASPSAFVPSIIQDEDELQNIDNEEIKLARLQTTLLVSTVYPQKASDDYLEVATIRSPYTFPLQNSQTSTRFITVTRTFSKTIETSAPTTANNHNIKPSKSFGSGEKSPLFDTASIPAPENILATSKPHFNLQEEYSTIETLAAITLPASYTDSPPFKTVTETLSTNEVMVKRTILPIIVGSETSEYTLSQTYTVARLVTAVKTIPPMEMYEFSPSKSFADVDAHFEPAGSENREQLLPGELEFSDQDNFGLEGPTPVRVTPPPGFLDDLDLIGAKLDFVDKMEEKHNPDIFNLKNTPNIEPSIQQAAISPSRPTFATPSLPVNPALAGLGISPEQLLYLQLLQNPLAALGLGGIQPQVVTESTPVYRTETVYETDTINLRLGNKDLTTYLTNAVSVTTHTDYTYNTRTVNQGLSLGGFGSLGGGLNQPQPQQQPQNALAGLLQPSFTVVSSPVTLNTVVTETITEEFKITFRNRPTVTYFESTTVKSTQITSYVTKTQRVIPTANPFAGLLG